MKYFKQLFRFLLIYTVTMTILSQVISPEFSEVISPDVLLTIALAPCAFALLIALLYTVGVLAWAWCDSTFKNPERW